MARCQVCRGPLEAKGTGRPCRYCSPACRQAAYRRRARRAGSVHFSSRSCEWATPPELVARLAARWGPFDLDPCATAENAKAPRFYTRADDGLRRPWTGRVFCNPPYGRAIAAWVAKAREAATTTADLVVLLVPARTDTRWWHEHVAHAEVEFLPGRVRFVGAKAGAPFPSAVVVFRNAKPGAAALRN